MGIQGCTPPVVPINESTPQPLLATEYSPDSLNLKFSVTGVDPFPVDFVPPDIADLCKRVWPGTTTNNSDTLFPQFVNLASKLPPEYYLQHVDRDTLRLTLVFQVDTVRLVQLRDSLLFSHQSENGPDTDGPSGELLSALYLLLPCEGVSIPKDPELLPNSPREYRNGTHRGIDFQATWGTPVRAVAAGVVLRADHEFQESPPELFQDLLKEAHRVGFTPWDLYYSRLLGQAIIIDHGLNLVPGFRVISIYAHLSHIREDIRPGTTVAAGDILGRTGNTGTEPSTYGTRNRAHLHWEMIFQNQSGEYYLGQGMKNHDLVRFLAKLFSDSGVTE